MSQSVSTEVNKYSTRQGREIQSRLACVVTNQEQARERQTKKSELYLSSLRIGSKDGTRFFRRGRNEAEFKADFNLEIGSDVQAFGTVLDDLNTLGASASDGQFIVATGAGAFAYESGATARTSMGAGTLDNIVEDATPQLGGDLDCNGKNITDVHEVRFDAIPDTDHTANGPTTDSINAGASIATGQLCHLASDGEWALADADAATTTDKLLAIALASGSDGNPMKVALPGSFVRDDTWTWTVGGAIYVSTTAGAMTQTAPSATDDVIRVVGYALNADVIYFMPETGVTHT